MMQQQTKETLFLIPSYYIGYCAYGDEDGLTESEINTIDKFMNDNDLSRLANIEDEPEFEPYNDINDEPGLCIVAEFTLRG